MLSGQGKNKKSFTAGQLQNLQSAGPHESPGQGKSVDSGWLVEKPVAISSLTLNYASVHKCVCWPMLDRWKSC